MTDTLKRLELVSGGASDQIADYIVRLIGPARPRRFSKMTRTGDAKYLDQKGEFTHAMLQAHAEGHTTYAITLDQNGKACAGVIDVDHGGRAAVLRVLRAAHKKGLTCYAFVIEGPDHSGGHVWFTFSRFLNVADILALLDQVRRDAGLPDNTELWPRDKANNRGSDQGIRAPLGYHMRCKTRGELLTQNGEVVNLDTNLASGVDLVMSLPLNAAPDLVKLGISDLTKPDMLANVSILAQSSGQTANNGNYAIHSQVDASVASIKKGVATLKKETLGEKAAARMASGAIDTRAIGAAVRERFNAKHTWPELLSRYSGVETRDGWACNCGHKHAHATQIAITSQDKIVSFSPNCRWAPHKDSGRALDRFGFYVDQEHGGHYMAAVEALAREYGLWVESRRRRADPPLGEPPVYRTATQAADAERKRAARRRRAAETIAEVQARANQDAKLSDRAQLVLLALLETAGDRDWTRASVARLAETAAVCERSVHEGLRELEAAHYIESSRRNGSTSFRTFIRLQGYVKRADESLVEIDSPEPLELVRGGLPTAANVYATAPDEWEVSEAPIGDDLLIWLVEQETQHNTTPPCAGADSADTPTRAPEPKTAQNRTPEKSIVLNTEPPDQDVPDRVLAVFAGAIKSEPPAIVSVSNPDARGMQLVRWSDGSATWSLTEKLISQGVFQNQAAPISPIGKNCPMGQQNALAASPDPVRFGVASQVEQAHQAAFADGGTGHVENLRKPEISAPVENLVKLGISASIEPHTADKTHYANTGAIYDPALDWTAGGRIDLAGWRDPCEIRLRTESEAMPSSPATLLLSDQPEDEPTVRCAPTDLEASAKYYALRGRAAKKTTSPAQRQKLDRLADALMIWLPASQAPDARPRDEPVAAAAGHWGSNAPASQARARSAPARADNAPLWAT